MNTKFIAFAFTTALAASGVAFAAEQEKWTWLICRFLPKIRIHPAAR